MTDAVDEFSAVVFPHQRYAKVNEHTIQLHNGEVALFGYGSLLSVASLEHTLQRRYDGPFLACSVEGWRRAWDVAMPNQTFYTETPSGCFYPRYILYLNVKQQPGILLNGVLFIISVEELKAMDQREWIYNRKVITAHLRGVSIIGGDAYMYVAKPEHLMTNVISPATAAIRATYLQILETGIGQLGPRFREAYNRSSDTVPQHLVINDMRDERLPIRSGESSRC